MGEVIKLYKNLGETPLECIERFRAEHPGYEKAKMTYLGRLDPMAEGVLLVLAGSMRDKDKYLELDKTYEFEVLWGFETDTYDILGLITATGKTPEKLENKMPGLLKKILDKKTQSYPPFSSKAFRGNYLIAREGVVDTLDIPDKRIRIFDILHIHTRFESGQKILEDILNKISLVKGDFRQKEISKMWQSHLAKASRDDNFLISKFRADVSSGTYIRSLANEMGHQLDTSALAYSIKRTRLGEYRLADRF